MDPLAQLKDIHLPADIHNYPIAPGWWLIALIILASVIFSTVKLKQFFAKRKAKKRALQQLKNANDTTVIVSTLKWALLQYFPRQQVANLSGNTLKMYLSNTLPEKYQEQFQDLSKNSFNSVYQKLSPETTNNFKQAASLWLNHALPPKQNQQFVNGSQTMNNVTSQADTTPSLANKNLGAKS